MYFLNREIHLIESLHIGFFIMNLHEVPLFIVLSQLAQQSSELYSVIAALDVFEKHMLDVLFEDVEGEDEREEVRDLFLKKDPEVMLSA